jgi:hypothetical protein
VASAFRRKDAAGAVVTLSRCIICHGPAHAGCPKLPRARSSGRDYFRLSCLRAFGGFVRRRRRVRAASGESPQIAADHADQRGSKRQNVRGSRWGITADQHLPAPWSRCHAASLATGPLTRVARSSRELEAPEETISSFVGRASKKRRATKKPAAKTKANRK